MNIGAFGENFPYTNFHDLNLDWIIKMVKELNTKFDEAISAKIKFANPIEWDITKQYEALTLVIDDNKAYLSMQPVPSGIDITNEDYWQNVFDMNELIQMQEDYEDRVDAQIDAFEQAYDSRLDELDETTIKNNSTKHILWVGDSYSTFHSGKLFTDFVNAVGVPASQCHSVAESGAGFTIAQTKTFLQEIQDYTGNKNEITDIIVCGGINDALLAFHTDQTSYPDTSVLTNAIDAFRTYANTNYPNAKLHIAYVGGCRPTSEYYESLHPFDSQEWAFWGYTIYAGGNGYHVLQAWNAIHSSHLNYGSDNLHPSQTGCQAIGEAVASAFNSNPLYYNRPAYIYTWSATGKNSKAITSFVYTQQDILTVSTPDNYIRIKNGETISNDQWYPVLTCNTIQIREPHFYNVMAGLSGFTGLSGVKQVPVCIMVRDGVMSIKVVSVTGSAYDTLTAGSYATITFYCLPDMVMPMWETN